MDNNLTPEKFKDLLTKIEALRADKAIDLTSDEDLSLAIMNLISLEEHFFFTGAKTEQTSYYDLSSEVREVRKSLMKKLLPENEGETWCAVKHLLATSMRLIEVGQKLRRAGDTAQADEMFSQAYKVYSIFWGVRFKLLDINNLKQLPDSDKPLSLEDLVTKLADCCNE
jgi:hypothetical protein